MKKISTNIGNALLEAFLCNALLKSFNALIMPYNTLYDLLNNYNSYNIL